MTRPRKSRLQRRERARLQAVLDALAAGPSDLARDGVYLIKALRCTVNFQALNAAIRGSNP